MEAKFTQGEWKAKTDSNGINTALVYLSDKGGFDLSGSPDCIANAHLISAAPEMYEFLYCLLNNARLFIATIMEI